MHSEKLVLKDDVIAFVLPNCSETAITFLAGAITGIVNPINALLEPKQISHILRDKCKSYCNSFSNAKNRSSTKCS